MDLEEQYDKIFRYCCFRLCDSQLAQDITQETFLRYYSRNIRLDNNKELAYLYTIARNLCADAFRQKPLFPLSDADEGIFPDTTEVLIDSLTLRSALEKLPQEEQELLFPRYVNELPIASICKMTSMSRFAVYRRLSKAVKQLKGTLEKEGFFE